jgi:hypothetical protein
MHLLVALVEGGEGDLGCALAIVEGSQKLEFDQPASFGVYGGVVWDKPHRQRSR